MAGRSSSRKPATSGNSASNTRRQICASGGTRESERSKSALGEDSKAGTSLDPKLHAACENTRDSARRRNAGMLLSSAGSYAVGVPSSPTSCLNSPFQLRGGGGPGTGPRGKPCSRWPSRMTGSGGGGAFSSGELFSGRRLVNR